MLKGGECKVFQAKYCGNVDLGISNGDRDKGTYLASILELEQQELI